MKIFFNDESRDVADGASIAELLSTLKLEPRHVAVEVNYQLVPRQRHSQHLLMEGDRLEVVTLVGGG